MMEIIREMVRRYGKKDGRSDGTRGRRHLFIGPHTEAANIHSPAALTNKGHSPSLPTLIPSHMSIEEG